MKRVLIVEDEPGIAENLRYALTTDGFEVVWSTTGGEALDLLAAATIACVILDIGLPDINGFDLCREIRRDSDVPIIFLTARGEEVDRVVGLELGGDDYVVKPFSPREVSARVRAVLRRIQGGIDEPEAYLEVGPLRLKRRKHTASCGDHELVLSRYEFRLLEVLMARPGWVYSREKLMALAWDDPDASMLRTVDTHIKTLRTKLREARGDDLIVTHRGVGYALKESP